MTNTAVLKCQYCDKEYVRRVCLEKHIKAKHVQEAPHLEDDEGEGYIVNGPIFQHPDIVIPDNLDDFPDADDQELRALAEELESNKNCDKCDDSNNREKKTYAKT